MKKGFTLIELLVVIAIIGILSSILMTFLNNARLASRDSRIASSVRQFKNLMELNRGLDQTYDTTNIVAIGSDGERLTEDVCAQQGAATTCGTQNSSNRISGKTSGIIILKPSSNTSYCIGAWLTSSSGGSAACADSSGIFKSKYVGTTPCNITTDPYKCN